MKRLFSFAATVLGLFAISGVSAFAHQVTVNTSCGKTITVESDDYSSAEEMLNDVLAVDEAVCP
ncbi:hypothetical protein [Porphyromonas bennonis]|uniref:hypothetical protein n=1 Tax=Porphyromonas bennonis TaxID=501496 RepID=UPI00035F08CA|nr:hypothetical protein [Porphyromonas bennonis]